MKDKKSRFITEVEPWLEGGVVRISDEETPFNMALRYLCENFFDIDPKKPHPSLDAGDALYHAMKLIPEVLRMPVVDSMSPGAMNDRGSLWHPLAGKRPTEKVGMYGRH